MILAELGYTWSGLQLLSPGDWPNVAMEWVDDKVEKVVALVTKIIVPLSYLFFGSTFLLSQLYLSPILRLGDFQMTCI